MPYQGTSAPSRAEATISRSGAPITGLRAAADLLAQVPAMPGAYVTVSKSSFAPDSVSVQFMDGELADRIAAVKWLSGVLDDAPHAFWNGAPTKHKVHYFEVGGTFGGVRFHVYAVVPVRELTKASK